MKAMILAAGRGERMRPLTDTLPKPLLPVAGKPLIVYHLEKLSAIGVKEVVINVAYLGEKIQQMLGDGSQWGVSIQYSIEPQPLETAGALLHCLPLLGDEPFLLINGDVWSDIDFSEIMHVSLNNMVGHLFFVDNPAHNPQGDFSLHENHVQIKQPSLPAYTFSGMALIHPKMIAAYPEKRNAFPLKEVFLYYIQRQQLSGSIYRGAWCDVGTPERLAELDHLLSNAKTTPLTHR